MKIERFSKTTMLVAAVAVGLPVSGIAGEGDGAPFSLKTERGKSYRGCKVRKVDPDGLTVSHSQGIAKIAFTELSEAVQKRHGYDKEKSEAFIKKHTEVVKKVVPARGAPRRADMALYLPSGAVNYGADYGYGYGYGYPYYSDYYGYGQRRSYPYYHTYPNVSFQVGAERRAGNPIAPSLVSPSNFQQQQNAVQNRAGFPAPSVPVVRPRISTPNRPSAVFPKAAPRITAPRISRPSRALPSKR